MAITDQITSSYKLEEFTLQTAPNNAILQSIPQSLAQRGQQERAATHQQQDIPAQPGKNEETAQEEAKI